MVAGALALVLGLGAATATALPPYTTVASNLERFRGATGDLTGTGRLEYGGARGRATLVRRFGEPPRLRAGSTEHVADWRDPALDPALRLLGVALGASDLEEALGALGRPLTEDIWSLAFLDGVVCYILGGALGVAPAHVWLERDTYRLRRLEVSLPDGRWAVALDDYDLAAGWFPARVTVSREGREVLRLELDEVTPA
jgi:hypothetical protein